MKSVLVCVVETGMVSKTFERIYDDVLFFVLYSTENFYVGPRSGLKQTTLG